MAVAALDEWRLLSAKVGDFMKRSKRRHDALSRRHEFASRRHSEADKSVRSGDYSKATQALLKVDAKTSLANVEKAAHQKKLPTGKPKRLPSPNHLCMTCLLGVHLPR